MKAILVIISLISSVGFGQTYDGLQKLDHVKQIVYFSENAKDRALKIADNVAKAEVYFAKHFNVRPKYHLLVLSPSDWKKYAHPNAIYGIPHYLPDGRLVVAAENNAFWKRNTPSLGQLPAELSDLMKSTYTDKNGEVALTDFFDLLAVHELGHAFVSAAGMKFQRSWLSELLCNVLLHTFIAENKPQLLASLTTFPKVTVATFPAERLKYTTLEDFETFYNEIAQNHPDNYGWYQCRFHTVAAQIYESGGTSAMESLWSALLAQKEKLSDKQLNEVLMKTPAIAKALEDWNKLR